MPTEVNAKEKRRTLKLFGWSPGTHKYGKRKVEVWHAPWDGTGNKPFGVSLDTAWALHLKRNPADSLGNKINGNQPT